MKKVAILQSNYIPWKGYFDLIASVDEVIIYDDMQYTRRDWRNRNLIKTPQDRQWLTVPVVVKGKYHQKIKDTLIDGSSWAENHWKSISQNYKKAEHFKEIASWLQPILIDENFTHLYKLNRCLIDAISKYLNITTNITNSWDYSLSEGKSVRLADLCVQAEATEYISGPAAKGYINEKVFNDCNISVTWFDYSGYLEYPQLWGEFIHEVTVLDLLFNCGPNSNKYMKYI